MMEKLTNKFLCKCSILITVFFIMYIIFNRTTMYFEPINLYFWSSGMVKSILVAETILWFRYPHYVQDFNTGDFIELCFNVLPIEIFMLVFFAQYHFAIAIAIGLICIGAIITIEYFIYRISSYNIMSKNHCKVNRITGKRLCVLFLSLVLMIPSFCSVFVYHMKSPHYESQGNIQEQFVDKKDEEIKRSDSENIFDKHQKLLRCFQSSIWEQFKIEERLSILQALVNLETTKLGCPPVKVESTKLFLYTLGEYSETSNKIVIDSAHISTSPVDKIIDTCLHETYHAFQAYVVSNIDWDSNFSNCAFFEQARNWKYEEDRYLDGYEDYDAYTEQDLEKSANKFAEDEGKAILSYVESISQPS